MGLQIETDEREDLDRQGFNYPILPVTVNCYGRDVVRNRGGGSQVGDEADPPAPSPRRCFELGRATARILRESPWRVVLLASSSWSHAFLTEKNHFIYPDLEADRALLAQLRAGDYDAWRDLSLAQMEASGQHEVLNWVTNHLTHRRYGATLAGMGNQAVVVKTVTGRGRGARGDRSTRARHGRAFLAGIPAPPDPVAFRWTLDGS